MKRQLLAAMVCVIAVMNVASADLIRGINIDFVTIGNAGNPGDTRVEAEPYGCGAVGYEYQIGKYEVTNAQWNSFTAAAGTPTGNPNDAYRYSAEYTGDQQPTNCVSWYETLQFCNYLTSGDKSKGVYQFSGNNANPDNFLGIKRAAAQAMYDIIYFLPTEDEWYKAAYYNPDGSGYSLYANGTSTAPMAGVNTNYGGANPCPWNIGSGTMEQNGTFDMMGNVWEWNETLIYGNYDDTGNRGSSYYGGYDKYYISSSVRAGGDSKSENYSLGFRVASVPEPPVIPAPGAALLGTIGVGLVTWLRRRRTL